MEHEHTWAWELHDWRCSCGATKPPTVDELRAFTRGLVIGRDSKESVYATNKRAEEAGEALARLIKVQNTAKVGRP